MATKSRAELVLQVLKNLGVLAEGQTPGVEDTAGIDNDIPALLAEFAGREIVYVPDIDNAGIDEALFMSIASMIAYEEMDSYGVTGLDAEVLKNKNDEAFVKLKSMLRGRPTYETIESCYF